MHLFEWSKERDLENVNCKIYHEKPIIETKDWTDAFKWNAKSHKVIKLDNIYFTSEKKPILTKEECKDYLNSLKVMPWLTLDDMLLNVNSILQIKININCWENSECSCGAWLKNYKCNHVIAISCRLKLCDFTTVAMAQPIGMKRRKGRPKSTMPALIRQPTETVDIANQLISEEEEEDEHTPPLLQPAKKKRK